MSLSRRMKRILTRTPEPEPDLEKRLEEAHAAGQPVEVDPDEVTGVLDLAIGRMRKSTDAGVARVREVIRKLESSKPPAPSGASA